jgi:hypothetical protein
MHAWRYLDGNGEELGSSDLFADRESAESWMGEAWPDLLDRGVEEVVLMDEATNRRVFRMGLGEEEEP